jgi:hypothetical protein
VVEFVVVHRRLRLRSVVAVGAVDTEFFGRIGADRGRAADV